MERNIYQELTREFNVGRVRAILSSGQAVVMHRLAVMSKDGDWILREDAETTERVLNVLESRGARYRFGAPMDPRWLAGGWSAHFEFSADRLRVRTDFVTRPPRIAPDALAALWTEAERSAGDVPFVDIVTLGELKKTNRERDYAIIGELARKAAAPRDRLRLSRSARDLIVLAREYPALVDEVAAGRPLLRRLGEDIAVIEAELDVERRRLMHANERRLQAYLDAAAAWASAWPALQNALTGLPLREAHRLTTTRAEALLPQEVELP